MCSYSALSWNVSKVLHSDFSRITFPDHPGWFHFIFIDLLFYPTPFLHPDISPDICNNLLEDASTCPSSIFHSEYRWKKVCHSLSTFSKYSPDLKGWHSRLTHPIQKAWYHWYHFNDALFLTSYIQLLPRANNYLFSVFSLNIIISI